MSRNAIQQETLYVLFILPLVLEYTYRLFQKLRFPVLNLVGMQSILVRQFGQTDPAVNEF